MSLIDDLLLWSPFRNTTTIEYLTGPNFIEEYREAPTTSSASNRLGVIGEERAARLGRLDSFSSDRHAEIAADATQQRQQIRRHSEHQQQLSRHQQAPAIQLELPELQMLEYLQNLARIEYQNSGATRSLCCSFCYGTECAKSRRFGILLNKDDPGRWSTHSIKWRGLVTCPVLYRQVCRVCGATGFKAHTTAEHDRAMIQEARESGRRYTVSH
ncbi:hypothetical protein B9Z55_006856 [Caenorhabditis nigoni]|uniref:Nanos-type domain-containing protein n=1 Tax=Caenorhabditis nigoni TaxID=1611254 RepID=A0A2G5V6U8_9PELO|nr:hypothetical protein B9Z55_006856 [Caenorhabditis nigoni]